MWLLSCADERYVAPLAVTVYSAVTSLEASTDVHYVAVLDRVSEDSADRLRRLGTRLGIDLHLVDAAGIGFGELSLVEGRKHITAATYLRLFADRALPPSADRVLYLDSDTLVCSDLAPLYAVHMGGRAVAAARDSHAPTRGHPLSGTLVRDDRPYFNAGVLLIDLERMRAGLGDRLREEALRRPDARWFDQDILNDVLSDDDWLELAAKWNTQDIGTDITRTRDVGIVHFSSRPKPWDPFMQHPSRGRWRETLRATGWQTRQERLKWETMSLVYRVMWAAKRLRYRLMVRTRLQRFFRLGTSG